MPLVIEDGTNVAGANSYQTVAEIRAYAVARGVVLAPDGSEGDTLVEQMAIKAMDYLEAMRSEWKGWKTYSNQRTQWPRTGVTIPAQGSTTLVNGFENIIPSGYVYLSPTEIPQEVKDAQCALAMQIKAGVVLQPTQVSGSFVVREKIGPIETQYSEAIAAYVLPQMPAISGLLEQLVKPSGVTRGYRA